MTNVVVGGGTVGLGVALRSRASGRARRLWRRPRPPCSDLCSGFVALFDITTGVPTAVLDGAVTKRRESSRRVVRKERNELHTERQLISAHAGGLQKRETVEPRRLQNRTRAPTGLASAYARKAYA
jgi:hypothetical protein